MKVKFSKSDIAMDDLVKDFFLAKDIRDSTKNHYLLRLSYYCSFISKTPQQMIEEAEKEEEDRVRMRRRKIKKYFLSWLEEMQKNGYSRSSISSYFASVKSFYRAFEIEIPQFTINSHGNNNKSFERIPNKEDIKKALQYANLKHKAIILLMTSSGMGSAEVRNLTYKNFLDAIQEYFKPSKNELFDIAQITEKLTDKRNIVPTWKIQRYKTGMPYITFSTPESLEAMLVYMNWRNKKYPFKSLDDWIFLADNAQITGSTLAVYFQRLNEKAGFEKLEHSVFFHSHALRKFFGTTLHRKGIQRLNYDFMMGHQIDKIAEAYIKPNIKALKREYMRCLEDLSIESIKVRRIESEEVKKIVQELSDKDKKLEEFKEKLDEKDKEMESMNERVKLVESLLSDKDFASKLAHKLEKD